MNSLAGKMDMILLIFLLLCTAVGYARGLVGMLARLVAMGAALMGAAVIAGLHSAGSQTAADMEGQMTDMASTGGVFLVSFVVLQVVLLLIVRSLNWINRIPVVGLINRLAGAFVGFVGTFFLLWLAGSWLLMKIPQPFLDEMGLTHHVLEQTMILSTFIN
mgnify:FL=1